eukprot:1478383-Alexandrium_andersonii.AAC.1
MELSGSRYAPWQRAQGGRRSPSAGAGRRLSAPSGSLAGASGLHPSRLWISGSRHGSSPHRRRAERPRWSTSSR